VSNDFDTFAFWYGGGDPGASVVSLHLGRAIKLTSEEREHFQKLGPVDEYKDYLEDIFRPRLERDGIDTNEFWDWLEEEVSYISSFDLLLPLVNGAIEVEGDIESSGNVFCGYEVSLPSSSIDLHEVFQVVQDDAGRRLKQVQKRISLEVEKEWRGASGSFSFERMEDLLGITVFEVEVEIETKIIPVSRKSPPDDYSLALNVRDGGRVLVVDFKYHSPENKRLRADKHFRLHAMVTSDDEQIWSGYDPADLEICLNQWCQAGDQIEKR
jgi:hypothetical protein